jgi:dTDP-4-dehydrorhamnose reductase
MSTNRKSLIALIALAAFGAAQAQEATPYVKDNFTSTKTRADVIAEVQSARRDGTLMAGNEGPATWALSARSMLERASVLKEAIAAARQDTQQQIAQRQLLGM